MSDTYTLVEVLLYADDLVLFSTSRFHLQGSLHTLTSHIQHLGLEINTTKTVAVKFRRGGRLAKSDEFRVGNITLPFANHFKYLGVVLPYNGVSFSRHIEDRTAQAMAASATIKAPGKLSLRSAIQLFDMKVAPAASYGIRLMWDHLSVRDLQRLERVKAAYLKRVLGVHRTSRNRYVYLLTSTPLFIEQLMKCLSLPPTTASRNFLEEWERKFADINPEFLSTLAMRDRRWEGPLCEHRSRWARLALHGFHHKLCVRLDFHEANEDCSCTLCGDYCGVYHADRCALNPPTWLLEML